PNRKVGREILEAMHLAGSHKQERAGFHRVLVLSVKELALSASDKVNFISRVRFLRIFPNRRVQLYHQCAAGGDRNGEISNWRRSLRQGFGKVHVNNSAGKTHAPTLMEELFHVHGAGLMKTRIRSEFPTGETE